MVHTMCPATSSASITNSPGGFDEKTVDALREFLQDMSRTIQALSNRHNMVCQSYQACPAEGTAEQTSISLKMFSISPAEMPSDQSNCREVNYGQGTLHPSQQRKNDMQQITGTCNPEESQNCTLVAKQQDRRSNFDEEINRAMDMIEIDGSAKNNAEESSHEIQFNAKTVDALRGFLEDMSRTIQTWSTRHDLLVQSHCINVEGGAEVLATLPPVIPSSAPSISFSVPFTDLTVSCPDPTAHNLNVVQTPPQPDKRETNVGQSAQPDQVEKNMEQNIHADHGEVNAVQVSQPEKNSQPDHHEEVNLVRSPHEEDCESHLPQSNPEEGIAYHLPQSDNTTDVDQTEKEVVHPSQLGEGNAKVVVGLPQTNSELQSTSQLGHEDMDMDFRPRPESGIVHGQPMSHVNQAAKAVESPSWLTKNWIAEVERQVSRYSESNDRVVEMRAQGSGTEFIVQQVKQQPYRRVAKVVESPEWLPKGWITEVKIRGRGNSAGSKDKYFYDPVTKRRFRSRREVFCFLETGKLGRYKPRCKNKLEDKFDTSRSSIDQNSKGQSTSAPAGCISLNLPTSSAPLASSSRSVSSVSPSSLFSSVFMPYRTGQPSDWLVYESLSSLPVPVFERFPHPEKDFTRLNGSRVSSDGWVFSNSEGAWRTYPYRNEVRKGLEGKDMASPQTYGGHGMQVSETVQKQSAAGTRGLCRKVPS